jgi:hypothetical protein
VLLLVRMALGIGSNCNTTRHLTENEFTSNFATLLVGGPGSFWFVITGRLVFSGSSDANLVMVLLVAFHITAETTFTGTITGCEIELPVDYRCDFWHITGKLTGSSRYRRFSLHQN